MKRTTRHPIRTLFLQLRVRLYYPDNIRSVFQIVDEVLRVEHSISFLLESAKTDPRRIRRENAYDSTALG